MIRDEIKIKGTSVFCPICKAPAYRTETVEEIKEKYKDNLLMQLEMNKIRKCSNPKCNHTWGLSQMEVLQAFSRKVIKGLSKEDKLLLDETVEKIKEIKKDE